MNRKIEEIKKVLMDLRNVSLAKQCKNEYIVYTFYADLKRENIIRETKEHFADKELNGERKSTKKKLNIPINQFLDEVIYDLLERGYELEMFE